MSKPTFTILCISCYFKGVEFLEACKDAGNKVLLITDKKLEKEPWPWNHIDEVFYLEEDDKGDWNLDHLRSGIAWLMKTRKIDRIVALDDFDVEKAAAMREEFRMPGMGQTTARHFRDKLAMRMKAREEGLRVPAFSALFNDEEINNFIKEVPPPWVVKPRAEASATGIRKIRDAVEVWKVLNELGADRYQYLIEQFKPGDVYHADSLSVDGQLIFCRTSRYLAPPLDVAHGGGIFRSCTVAFDGEEDKAVQEFTERVMTGFGMKFSAAHTEFIKCHEDGAYYFLETSSRVGGAHLSDMVEQSSGINLWREWANIETAMAKGVTYTLPKPERYHAGILVSLARQEKPDMSVFDDSEVSWKMDKAHHVGLIVKSKKRERVVELLDKYAEIVKRDFHASAPAPPKSMH